jgi:hypothetical protein
MEVGGQLHTPAALLLEEQPPVYIKQEAEWARSRSGGTGEEKNFLSVRWDPLPSNA